MMRFISKILPMLAMFGCGGQLQFDSSHLSRSYESGSGSTPETTDNGEEEELPDEEVGAQIPVIISGSFLNCLPVKQSSHHDQLICTAPSGSVSDNVTAGQVFQGKVEGNDFEFLVTAVERSDIQDIVKITGPKGVTDRLREIFSESQDLSGIELIPAGTGSEISVTPVSTPPSGVIQQDTNPAEGEINGTPDETPPVSPADPPAADPPANPLAPDLITNGSFEVENPAIPDSMGLGFFQKYPSPGITGWELASGLDIEVQKTLFNYPAAEGDQWVELCSTNNSGIKQDIATEAGKIYELIYYFSPRPGTAAGVNQMQLDIEGQTFDHGPEAGGAVPAWSQFKRDFVANDSQTTIMFTSTGCAGSSSGTWLDNISVRLKSP